MAIDAGMKGDEQDVAEHQPLSKGAAAIHDRRQKLRCLGRAHPSLRERDYSRTGS